MKQRNRLPRQARWAVPAAIATAIAETSMASTIAAAAAAPQLPSRTPAYVVSGQVRFRSLDSGAALSLAEVPPLIFTEAIRDADLVVRATSIGTDPDWLERGGSRRFGGVYWHRFGFGELGASAKVRREVLHRLLPGLTIADRCRLDGRYLRVRGDVHAYRITTRRKMQGATPFGGGSALGTARLLSVPAKTRWCPFWLLPGVGALTVAIGAAAAADRRCSYRLPERQADVACWAVSRTSLAMVCHRCCGNSCPVPG